MNYEDGKIMKLLPNVVINMYSWILNIFVAKRSLLLMTKPTGLVSGTSIKCSPVTWFFCVLKTE
jgi:hypothetical protein